MSQVLGDVDDVKATDDSETAAEASTFEDHLRLHHQALKRAIRKAGWRQADVARRLGWHPSRITFLVNQHQGMRFEDLFEILRVIGMEPLAFFASVYGRRDFASVARRRGETVEATPGSSPTLGPLAPDLATAATVLGTLPELVPATPSFERVYVERPWNLQELLVRAKRAVKRRDGRPRQALHAYLTGHRGVGKSTELHRALACRPLSDRYLVAWVDATRPATATAVLRDVAAACAWLVQASEETYRSRWRARLEAEGVLLDADGRRILGGEAELEDGAPPASLVALVDALAEEVFALTDRWPLLALDGLDHWPLAPLRTFLERHQAVLERPGLSLLATLPISLLFTPLASRLLAKTLVVSPILVYEEVDAQVRGAHEGFAFLGELLGRYVDVDRFTVEAIESLLLLSGGLVAAMLEAAREAIEHRTPQGQTVRMPAVHKVWARRRRALRRRLQPGDLDRLRRIAEEPFNDDVPELARLLHDSLVLLMPGRWLCVHPVLASLVSKESG